MYPYYPVRTFADRGAAKRLRRTLAKRGFEARVEKRYVVTVHPDDFDRARDLLDNEATTGRRTRTPQPSEGP